MKAPDGDFFALREYLPGDSTRLIAWRSTARLGHTVIRESASPRTRRAWIIIAADGASHLAVEGAVSLAAGAAVRLLAMGFEVGLLAPDSTVVVPTGRSKRHLNAMLDALAVYDPKGETPPVSAEPHTAPERDLRIVVAAQGAAATAAGDMRLVAEPAPSPPMQLAGEAESPLRWIRRALTGPSRAPGGER